MILTPAQATIAKDTHRFRVVNCGRRFGKSSLAEIEMVGKAIAKDNNRIVYVAPTYQQARDIAWQELKRICLPISNSINESRLEITVKTQKGGTSIILLRGWESIETLRGQAFDLIVLDEVAMMKNFWENWQEVLSPTLTDRKGEALFISTPKGFNHFYDLYNKQDTDPDFKSFHFTTYDNPHIPREEIERQKKSLPEDAFAQEYMADFRKHEGLVYKEFSRETHLFDDFTPRGQTIEHIAGVDFGFTNPCAVIMCYKDFDNTYWIYDEYYYTGKTEEQIAEVVSAKVFQAVYPDPENASAIEVLKRKNVNVRDVIKGKGSVASGISRIRELLKQKKVRIHKKCYNLIQELETYSYPEEGGEVPIKENDHALDAMRYMLVMNLPLQSEEQEEFSIYSTSYR